MLSADFWQDKNNSQKVIKEKKFYEDLTYSLNNNVEKLKDLDDLSQLAHEEENLQVQNEVLQNIQDLRLSLIHISEPTRLSAISYAVSHLNQKEIF